MSALLPRIKVNRYTNEPGNQPPPGTGYIGFVEPEGKEWIVYIDADQKPVFYGHRDPETGACLNAPVMPVIPSAHVMNDEVEVCFKAGQTPMVGRVTGIKFTSYGKVLYDVAILVTEDCYSTIHDVDSCFVSKPAMPEAIKIHTEEPWEAPLEMALEHLLGSIDMSLDEFNAESKEKQDEILERLGCEIGEVK